MRSTTYDPADAISEGIRAFGSAVPLPGLVAATETRYRKLAAQVRGLMKPGDTCTLAFAAEVEHGGSPRPGFAAILEDRTVLAWRLGPFRPRFLAETVHHAAVTSVSVEPTRPAGSIAISVGKCAAIRVNPPSGSEEVVCRALRSAMGWGRPPRTSGAPRKAGAP